MPGITYAAPTVAKSLAPQIRLTLPMRRTASRAKVVTGGIFPSDLLKGDKAKFWVRATRSRSVWQRIREIPKGEKNSAD